MMKEHSENDKKKTKKEVRGVQVLLAAMGIVCLGLLGTGLALPLRPSYSASEKRALAAFPAVTRASPLSGQYFTDLTSWFSDTFPGRETLLTLGAKVESLYGPQGDAFYGNDTQTVADTIPETAESLAPVMELGSEEDSEETASASELRADASAVEALDQYASLIETNADGTLKEKKSEKAEVTGEKAGSIYVTNHCGYEIYYYNQGGAVKYASMINTYQARFPQCTVYDILVPNSFGVMLDAGTQAALGSSNMEDGFNYIYSLMDPAVKKVSVFDTLRQHKSEYLYFHTDHHWTALGAYYAYMRFCAAKGIEPHSLREYEKKSFDGFYGTFYFSTNRSEALKQNPDTVEAWVPMATNQMEYIDSLGEKHEGQVIGDVTDANAGDKYSTFIHGDNPLTVIHNPLLHDGSACVLIKESYGNAFAPYLVDHYENVYVVDYRHYEGDLGALIENYGIQDIIFLNNAVALSERAAGLMLGLLETGK